MRRACQTAHRAVRRVPTNKTRGPRVRFGDLHKENDSRVEILLLFCHRSRTGLGDEMKNRSQKLLSRRRRTHPRSQRDEDVATRWVEGRTYRPRRNAADFATFCER